MGESTSCWWKWQSAQSIPSMLVPELRPRTVKSSGTLTGVTLGILFGHFSSKQRLDVSWKFRFDLSLVDVLDALCLSVHSAEWLKSVEGGALNDVNTLHHLPSSALVSPIPDDSPFCHSAGWSTAHYFNRII